MKKRFINSYKTINFYQTPWKAVKTITEGEDVKEIMLPLLLKVQTDKNGQICTLQGVVQDQGQCVVVPDSLPKGLQEYLHLGKPIIDQAHGSLNIYEVIAYYAQY